MIEESKDLQLTKMLSTLNTDQTDDVQSQARSSLTTVFVLFRLAMMHSLNNDAFQKPISSLLNIINDYVSTYGFFSLKHRGDSFFVNSNMIRLDSASFTASEYLLKAFPRLGIGTILVSAKLESSHVAKMLEVLQKAESSRNEKERKNLLPGKQFGAISLQKESGEVDPLLEFKRDVQHSYALTATSVNELSQLGKHGRFPSLGKIKRLIQKSIDLFMQNPHIVSAMACHYYKQNHNKTHPVNVMILSIQLGHAINLDRKNPRNQSFRGQATWVLVCWICYVLIVLKI